MKLNKDSYSKLKLKRLCAAFEVIVFITPILWMVWAVPSLSKGFYPYAPLTLLTFIFALPIMSHLHHQENYQDLGFGLFNIKQGFSELLLPITIVAMILVTIGLLLGTLKLGQKFLMQIIGIPIWGLVQQYAAQSFINRRFQLVFGKGKLSITMTALIFAAMHLPNPALTAATAVAGYIWARQFQKCPNLYPIALSHGLLSALFVNVMPKWILPNMVVGYNYLIKQ